MENQEQKNEVQVLNPTETIAYLMSPIGQEVKSFELLQRQAMMYCQSTIVPMEYRGKEKIGNVIIAMDMARRLNANMLMIMQNLNVIQGRPAWSSKFLIATVNNCGRFNPIQYEFVEKGFVGKVEFNEVVWDNLARKNTYKKSVFDGTNVKNIECIAYTTRKGDDKRLESSPVNVKTAILEGWYTKNGSKWPNMTRQMLMYRAASWWTNVYAPDLSMGLTTSEEADDAKVIDLSYAEEVKDQKTHVSFDTAHDQQPETERCPSTDTPPIAGPAKSPDELFGGK